MGWQNEWKGRIVFSHGSEVGQAGVAILFPPSFPYPVNTSQVDKNGRFAVAEIVLRGNNVPIIGVYGPANDKQDDKCQFLDIVRDLLLCYDNHNTLLAGDFNIKLDALDSDSNAFRKTRASTKLRDILDEFSLQDSWRAQHPTRRQYTWRRTAPLQQSRIDYVFAGSSLVQYNSVKAKIDAGILSDHNFVVLNIDMSYEPRGPGIWRFNNSLLDDDVYVSSVRDEIRNASNNIGVYDGEISRGVLVEMMLSRIRVISIKRSKTLSRELRKEENMIYQRLCELDAKLAQSPCDQVRENYERTRDRLDEIKQEKGKSAILASRATWLEAGEKSTKYFTRLVEQRAAQRTITTLKNTDGSTVRGNKAILKTCADYYKALYESKPTDRDKYRHFVPDNNAPRLSEAEKLACEGLITKEEGKLALSKMALNKASGISGFSAEFYTFFWEDLGDVVIDYINEARSNGMFFIAHRRGVLTLIPKKGDQRMLENKRPICLLDVIYKLVAKVIALRIEKVIDKLIHRSQTGFLKGRYIGENLRLVADVIDYCKIDDIEGILLALDYKSAFDSIEHEFLQFTLECFNFGPCLRSWVTLLYTGAQLTVANNGYTSEWFPCTRGTFQGSPLSGLLFILAVELLAIKIRCSQNIHGIVISGQEVKFSQYADDGTLFLRNRYSVKQALEVISVFQQASGLELNIHKTKLLGLGKRQNAMESINAIEVVPKVKILGIWFNALGPCGEDNIAPVILKVKRTLNSWSQRSLTIKGRIVISKTLIASQIVYLAMCAFIEKVDLDELQRLLINFLWGGRPPKVAKATLVQPIKNGGLNAVDIPCFYRSLQLSWIKRMTCCYESPWRIVLQCRLGEYKIADLLKNVNAKTYLKDLKIPKFYKDIITMFHNLPTSPVNGVLQARIQSLWYNDKIKVGSKPIFNKTMYNCGIKYIDDIVGDDGNLLNYGQIMSKFPQLKIDFLTVSCLIRSIPSEWREIIKGNPRCRTKPDDKDLFFLVSDSTRVSVKASRSQHYYKGLLGQHQPRAESKWAAEGVDIPNWSKIYLIPYGCTKSTRIQSLHYRVIHRYIPTRKYLCTRGIAGSPLCLKCFATDTLQHFFCDCEDVTRLWGIIMSTLKRTFNLAERHTTHENILLGVPDAPPVVNLIILLCKQYIVNVKLGQQERAPLLNMETFISILKQEFQAEMLVGKRNSKVEAVLNKWHRVFDTTGQCIIF